MNCFDQVDLNVKNEFYKPKQDHNSRERLVQQQKDNKFDDNLSKTSHEDDNDSVSSYRSTTSANSQQSFLSQHSTRSVLDLPDNSHLKHRNKEEKSKFSLICIQIHIDTHFSTKRTDE
jgi:hypothetical protein